MEFSVDKAIEVLEATPLTLHALLRNLSDEWIQDPKSKLENTRWEPFDVVGHLIHADQTDWIPRARIIIEQGENRTFVPFDRFAQFEISKGKSLGDLLSEFQQMRSESIATLRDWSLTEEHLDLEGVHPELGVVTLRQLLATWVVHDLNHVRQVATSMATKYGGQVGPWKEYLSVLKSSKE